MIQAILERIDKLIEFTERRALLDDERQELRKLIPSAVAEAADNSRIESRPGVADLMRKPKWVKLVEFWDAPSKRIMDVSDKNILLQGTIEDNLAVCLVPQAIGPTQGDALRQLLEANLRMSVLLLTDNVQLMRMKVISDGIANAIMQGSVRVKSEGADG
jgi:hypothetical protein